MPGPVLGATKEAIPILVSAHLAEAPTGRGEFCVPAVEGLAGDHQPPEECPHERPVRDDFVVGSEVVNALTYSVEDLANLALSTYSQ
jgi:hypothetical protein